MIFGSRACCARCGCNSLTTAEVRLDCANSAFLCYLCRGRLEEQDTANEYSWRLDGTFKRASEGRGLNITTSAPVVVPFFTERAPDR